MKIRLLISAFIIAFFAVILSTQTHLVSAQTFSTIPLTYPITAPISYFKISGKVSFLRLRWFKQPTNVKVIAADSQGKQISTMTDTQGNYTLPVTAGKYRVSVSPVTGYRFVPQNRIANVKNSDVNHVNFFGIPLPRVLH